MLPVTDIVLVSVYVLSLLSLEKQDQESQEIQGAENKSRRVAVWRGVGAAGDIHKYLWHLRH